MRGHNQQPFMLAFWTMCGATVVRVMPVREAPRAVAKEVLGAKSTIDHRATARAKPASLGPDVSSVAGRVLTNLHSVSWGRTSTRTTT